MKNKKSNILGKVLLFPVKATASIVLFTVGAFADEVSKKLNGSGYISDVCSTALDSIWGKKSKEDMVSSLTAPFEDATVQYFQENGMVRKNKTEEERQHLLIQLEAIECNDRIGINYFVPDINGITGEYDSIDGVVNDVNVDPYFPDNSYITVDNTRIDFENIDYLQSHS